MNYQERKILTDADGVLLDWESSFTTWMEKEGYRVVEDGHYKQSVRFGISQSEADRIVKIINVEGTFGWINSFIGYPTPLKAI